MFWTSLHKDITYRLEKQNHTLYDEVQKVLRVNKEERHLRGGEATRRKYLHTASCAAHGGTV